MPAERIMIVSDVADREVDRVRNRLTPGSYDLATGREAVKRTLARLVDRTASIAVTAASGAERGAARGAMLGSARSAALGSARSTAAVAPRGTVRGVTRSVAPATAPVERWLDLIGHSNEHHFLTIGSWTIDENAPCYFEHQLRGAIERLHITRIRLLGCATATEAKSWNVIRAIAAALGGTVAVVGTLRLLDDQDYGPEGFVGVDALSPAGSSYSRQPPHAQDAIRTRGASHATRRHGGSSHDDTEHTCFPGRAHRLRRLG
jgi:hypothetical protein